MRRLPAALLLVAFSMQAAAAAEVVLKKGTVDIAKNKVYLSDVAAEYRGIDAKTKDRLQAIYLKMAAVPGHDTVITREMVQNRVHKYFKTVKVTGPEALRVRTSREFVNWKDIQDTALRYLRENMPWKEEEAEISVRGSRDDVPVIEGTILLKVREDSKPGFKGNMVVPVQIFVDGREYRIQPVSVSVRVVTKCLVASSGIERREIAPVTKVSSVVKDITYLPDDVMTEAMAQELQRMAAKRAIPEGTILTKSMFEVLPAFRRGETALVVVKAGAVMVESQGIAAEDGREGEKAKVKMENGRVLEGTVRGGKVEIIR